jgi:hypothetical protein
MSADGEFDYLKIPDIVDLYLDIRQNLDTVWR